MTNESNDIDIFVRDAAPADLIRIQAIYAHHVRHGLASFEEVPPDLDEIRQRHALVVDRGLPFLVARRAGKVAGYAYASPYHHRPAYRFTLENSVYVAAEAQGCGIGRQLLEELIRRCTILEYRQMIAVIGNSENIPSISLHAKLGFRSVGVLRSSGFKFGRWVDTVIMQRSLGPGDAEPPRGMV